MDWTTENGHIVNADRGLTVKAHLEIGSDVSLIGSDEIAIQLMLDNNTEKLLESTVKADILHTRLIEFIHSKQEKMVLADDIKVCQYTKNRILELKKLLLKVYHKMTGKLYSPSMPKENVKILSLEEIGDDGIDLRVENVSENRLAAALFCLRTLKNLEKLFKLVDPVGLDPKVLAQQATLGIDMEKIRAPRAGEPLYEHILKNEKTTVIN